MEQTTSARPTAHDHAALRNTLLKLTASQKILCIVVVAVVVIIWYDLLNRLIDFGGRMNYAGLNALGAQVIDFLQRYNAFFWWGIVALCSLLILYLLVGFVNSTRRRVRRKIVKADTFAELVSQLSEPAKEVLRWAWADTRHPVTVGDLQRAAHELRHARFDKIQLSRQHAQLLNAGATIARPESPSVIP